MTLDQAERAAPAETMPRRLAWWIALAAIAIGASTGLAGPFGLGPAFPAVGILLAPGLAATAILSLLRAHRLLSTRRAVAILILAWAAFGLAALTQVGWSLGFDLADAGRPMTGLAAGWMALFAAAWAVGAVALALLVDGLLVRGLARRPIRWLAAAASGLVVAPVIGLSLVQSLVTVLVAAGTAFFAMDRRGAAPARPLRRADASPSRPLAWLSAASGAAGIGYALTGSAWSPAATDGTLALVQGMTILLAAAIPLLAALGLRSRRGLATWGPLTCAIAALGAEAYSYAHAPEWNVPGATAAALAGGAAVGWWFGARVRAATQARVLIAVVLGAGYAAMLGAFVLRPLAFAVPVIAIVVALRPLSRGTRAPLPATAR
ncbi:hypothetical protein [Microbacterium rhizophilus]|uniref:hypothetical protein n=1 Tax=Microbacterium rhizophilus TaxID=3138934 RepID=UPI0031F0C30C